MPFGAMELSVQPYPLPFQGVIILFFITVLIRLKYKVSECIITVQKLKHKDKHEKIKITSNPTIQRKLWLTMVLGYLSLSRLFSIQYVCLNKCVHIFRPGVSMLSLRPSSGAPLGRWGTRALLAALSPGLRQVGLAPRCSPPPAGPGAAFSQLFLE